MVIPATQNIYRQALKEGLIDIFMDAEAVVSAATCGPCLGGHMGVLGPNEVCMSSSQPELPRPHGPPGFPGLPGQPGGRDRQRDRGLHRASGRDRGQEQAPMPRKEADMIKGTAHKFGDNVDTDQIIPAQVSGDDGRQGTGETLHGDRRMRTSRRRPKPGDILVAGNNFGCGSSREHAPLAIKGDRGWPSIIAESFARIFFRNCINIGMPIWNAPKPPKRSKPATSLRSIWTKASSRTSPRGKPTRRSLPEFMQKSSTPAG